MLVDKSAILCRVYSEGISSDNFLQPKELGWARVPFQPQPAFGFLGSEDPSGHVVDAVFSGGNLAAWPMLSNVL